VADAQWTWLTRLAFLVLATCWGLNYPFVALGLQSAPALWLAFLRAAVGLGATAALVTGVHGWGTLDGPGRRDAAALGLLNTGAFFGLWFWAAEFVTPGIAAVVIYTYPLWVAILSIPVLQSRLAGLQWASIAVGFVGVAVISQIGIAGSRTLPLAAGVALGLAAISWAIGTVLFRRRFSGREMLEANVFQLAGGTAGLLVATVAVSPTPLPGLSVNLAIAVLWLGVVGTALAYSIWYTLLGRTQAATLSAYLFLVPVVALAASAVFLGERLSAYQFVGVGLVLVSIYGVSRGGIVEGKVPPGSRTS
jgi:drug/metabolite transporter (DMT)-like permease